MHRARTKSLLAFLALSTIYSNSIYAESLPQDFTTTQGMNGLSYQHIGDSRPTNVTNSSNTPLTDLVFSGDESFGNGTVQNVGPAYLPDFGGIFPYVMHDSTRNLVLLHPIGRLGESPSIGSAVTFEAPLESEYEVTGSFARANNLRNAGNGVDVVIAKNGDLTALLFEEDISSDHDVDADDPFSGTGVADFSFSINLLSGEQLNFVTFVDAQGNDQDFDVTALQFDITAIPEPASAWLLMLGGTLISRRLRFNLR